MSATVNVGSYYRHLLGDDGLDEFDTKELFVYVELWLPSSLKTAGPSRKPGLPRRKSDRRESLGAFSNAFEERKIKEKPSWFRSYGGSATVGSWRSATCKLIEEGDKCSLNIYVDDSILQHSVYIHLLRSTDIRLADRSLFFRSDCLCIHAKAGQRWIGSASDDAIYLKFPNTDELNTWLALLRSYTTPEIYGRRLFPQEGGLYRMWRQIELIIKEGRHFSSPKINDDGLVDPTESEPTEMDIFCEIDINNSTFGRTIVRTASGSFTMGAKFIFDDLPPFDKLQINVLREKRTAKPSVLGSVTILLSNFRRGSELDVWYPVIGTGMALSGFQVGELRLNLKVDEEIILPSHSYAALLKTISRRNGLDILNDLHKQLRLNVFPLVDHMVHIAISHNVLTRDIIAFAEGEVDSTPGSQNTLFRGKTVLTKAIDCAMHWYGKRFLEASVGPIIRQFCAEKLVIDMDSTRVGKKELDKNAELLAYWCNEFWKQIYSVRADCPPELCRIFHNIRILVEKRRPDDKILKWQSVSTFCFLRFFAPAILEPQRFGLYPGLPSPQTSHSLKEVAKVIQSLANLHTNSAREDHPTIKQFMTHSVDAMIDYLLFVSSEPQDQHTLPAAFGRHEQLQAMNSLRERLDLMPVLHREALPLMPNNLLDLPKHAAVISSAVMRSPSVRNKPTPSQLDEFIRDCTEIESKALLSVKKLVPSPHLPSHHRRQSTALLQNTDQDQSRSQIIDDSQGRDTQISNTSARSDANTVNFAGSPIELVANNSPRNTLSPDATNRNRKSRPVSVGSSNAISAELWPGKTERFAPDSSTSALQHNALSRTRSHGAASKLSTTLPTKSNGPDDPKQKKGFFRALLTRN